MERKSLDEINGSVDVPNVYQSAFWQKFLAYSGPGALVAVGYMDPGNWLTSLAGGSQYRYQLLVVLFFLHFGIRRIEFIVLTAILVVGAIFAIEVCRAHPEFSAIMDGFVPRSSIFTNHSELLISLGIVGATIMPHNIYLHSSLAQSRRYDEHDPKQVKETLRFANWDSLIHLFAAFIVNALLLILGGTLFFHTASLGSLEDVFFGLKNPQIVGSLASPLMCWLFAFALLITGLISSITSTLAGQIVMEGFINIRLPLWKRRLLTRAVTLVPILIIGFMINFNEEQFEQLIIYAQIVLSIALPFTLYPLVALTGNKKLMGPHVNSPWQTVLGYILASLVTGLNLLVLV